MTKRIIIFLLISLTLATCTGQAVVSAQVRYTIIPESPRPGDPITIGINVDVKDALLFVNNRQIAKAAFFSIPPVVEPPSQESAARRRRNIPAADPVISQPGFMAAVLTIPSTLEARNAVIILHNEGGIVAEIPIDILPREFRSETIRMTPSLTSLVSDPNPQRTAESERLWEILTTTGTTTYHQGPFVLPVTSTRRTSQFGTRRVNQYSDGRRTTSIHAGVDFGIPLGTEVYACGRGMVVLSRFRIISGYSVIIEHAPGIYSLYYHLDSVSAQEGSIVEVGEIIGLSGSTGFSTGPHLHWEIRVNTENTDPDALVDRPLIDKDLIISRIIM